MAKRLVALYGEVAAARMKNFSPVGRVDLFGVFALRPGKGTRTQQHLRDEVDINTIVRRFGLTGQFPIVDAGGMYGDFTNISDYASAVAVVERADRRFMELPAEVREKFANSPAEFIAFARSASRESFDQALRVAVAAPLPVVPPPVAEVPS